MILVKSGSPLPLVLQLASGVAGKFPQALLKNENGQPITGPIDLADAGDGLYVNSSFAMPPGVKIVVAVFKVFDDSGHALPSTSDNDALDLFILDTFAAPTRNDELVGQFTGSELTAQIDGQVLEGTMVEETFTGEIETPTLVGSITDADELTGVFQC